ncbi:MAG: ADP-ribosylglycohydrolase family protein [Desulfobacterales bacterium]|nr:ADP-ribosylglycohydrolase family protein [Desulfobacterales bacterium]
MTNPMQSKSRGTLYGLCIGDALAMPVHWYYNRQALFEDYGLVTDYLAPRNPHPDSILWRSEYVAPNSKGEILHAQAQYWGQKNIHYHQFLKAGENTLNVKICRLLIESLNQNNAYREDDFLKRYISFMTTPGNHQDTYIEECHRNFFANYAIGRPLRMCGLEEKHIGGLIGIVPVVVFYFNRPEKAREAALAHLALTHPGPKMETAGTLIIDILLAVLNGTPLKAAILENLEAQKNPLLGYPFLKWLDDPDDWVVGPRFSTACYVEDSVPAVIYLALKYHDDPQRALIVNTNLGGDNAARGSVLAALLGAAHGVETFPDRWVQGLLEPLPDLLSP